jgi:3-(3-hydroxy-phenyl)propionate hydroxylase
LIQPQVLTKTGDLVLLDRVLGIGFAILGLNTDWLDIITLESQAFLNSLSIKLIPVVPLGYSDRFSQVTTIEDTSNQIINWLQAQQQEIVIIRPDRYIFGTCDRSSLNATIAQLKSLLIGDKFISKEQLGFAPLLTNKYK